MIAKSMKKLLRKIKKLNTLYTILDVGSPTVHGLIPSHMIHLHPTSCNNQINAALHGFFYTNGLGSWSKIYNPPRYRVLDHES